MNTGIFIRPGSPRGDHAPTLLANAAEVIK